MKTLLAIVLLATGVASAQDNYAFLSVGLVTTKPEAGSNQRHPNTADWIIDAMFKIGAVYESNEVYIQYQSAPTIKFQQYGVGYNRVFYPAYKLDLAVGVEGGSIIRDSNSNYLYYGANTELRYQINPVMQAYVGFNVKVRSDKEYLYDLESPQYQASLITGVTLRLN